MTDGTTEPSQTSGVKSAFIARTEGNDVHLVDLHLDLDPMAGHAGHRHLISTSGRYHFWVFSRCPVAGAEGAWALMLRITGMVAEAMRHLAAARSKGIEGPAGKDTNCRDGAVWDSVDDLGALQSTICSI
ncbi:hypothetical protein E4U31_004302 [Claviceps sp. LM219 group G6]|nr:hypothetical protein E4U31_004302 [Claviceps sp. LM219 group G6]